MTDFKVGDKVRYVGNDNPATFDKNWVGIEGEVTEVHTNIVYMTITKPPKVNSSIYEVGFDIYPSKVNLELITEEETFTYKDIQVCDLIRRTFVRSDGSKVIWEGTAIRKNHVGDKWMTKGDNILAHHSDDDFPDITLELLERPEPPHWTEEKPVGSVFLYGEGENKALWRKNTEDGWTRKFLINNSSHCYTNHEVKSRITGEQEWLK
jgi:hypothetical protein